MSHSFAFHAALDFSLKWEGGYVNHPNDPGGETKYGISKRAHPDVDIAALTKQQAADIYHKKYWTKIRGDELPRGVSMAVFDYAIHGGVSRAIRGLQRAVGGVAVDGQLGPITLGAARQAVHDLGNAELAYRVVDRRVAHLAGLVRRAPERYGVFLHGWLRRTHDLVRELASTPEFNTGT